MAVDSAECGGDPLGCEGRHAGLTPAALQTGSRMTDLSDMAQPAEEPDRANERLREAYARYATAYDEDAPDLLLARLDLALLLATTVAPDQEETATGDELPQGVRVQLERDAAALLVVTPALPD